jgi:hypothetical protein
MAAKIPTHNSTHSNHCTRLRKTHGVQELALSRPRLVTVALRVKIKRGLYFRVPQNPLHGLGLHPCGIHQIIRQ